MSATHCGRRGCRTRLVDRIDDIGRIVFGCAPCARNAKGICRDCPRPTKSRKSLRCVTCAATHQRQKSRDEARRARSNNERRLQINANRRRRYHEDPAIRAHTLASNAAYHRAHPEVCDDAKRTYARLYARRMRQNRQHVVAICLRRREVAELKRRGLWPAVQSLPFTEIPKPRRKLDRVALDARERRARAKAQPDSTDALRKVA